MGRNIALNMLDHGLRVTVYNHTAAVTEAFVAAIPADTPLHASFDLADLADSWPPRVVFLMATAGKVVDLVIDSLLPHLEEGDVIIDGGNSISRTASGAGRPCASTAFDFSAWAFRVARVPGTALYHAGR